MNIETTLFIHQMQWGRSEAPTYYVSTGQASESEYCSFICTQQVVLVVPDDYDPTAQKIAALEAQHAEAFEKFSKQAAEIKERISKLQSLEFKA